MWAPPQSSSVMPIVILLLVVSAAFFALWHFEVIDFGSTGTPTSSGASASGASSGNSGATRRCGDWETEFDEKEESSNFALMQRNVEAADGLIERLHNLDQSISIPSTKHPDKLNQFVKKLMDKHERWKDDAFRSMVYDIISDAISIFGSVESVCAPYEDNAVKYLLQVKPHVDDLINGWNKLMLAMEEADKEVSDGGSPAIFESLVGESRQLVLQFKNPAIAVKLPDFLTTYASSLETRYKKMLKKHGSCWVMEEGTDKVVKQDSSVDYSACKAGYEACGSAKDCYKWVFSRDGENQMAYITDDN